MTAYDLYSGTGAVAQAGRPSFTRQEKVVDFKLTPYVSGDVLKLFYIAAGQTVLRAGCRILRKEGSASTAHLLGESGDTNGFLVSIDANATVGTPLDSWKSGSEKELGKFYASADGIIFTLAANISNAKIAFWADVSDSGQDYATES